jgi:multifunctional beta-oxidation protein
MTDNDWDLIHRVHLQGAYAVTKAAWPHMVSQNYGRIIMTASAAGLYGNYGQTNYASAKMGLYGFGMTLAREGAKKNIFCNVVAPLAGSRITETVMPPDLIEALKPDHVAPMVCFLCHEGSGSNGGLYEIGGGLATKLRWERAVGALLKVDDEKGFTPGAVKAVYGKICDFSKPFYPSSMSEVDWVGLVKQSKALPSNPKGENLRFDGRVALITGSGAGIGRAYALMFAKYGAKVVVNDISQANAQAVVDEIGRQGGTAIAIAKSIEHGEEIVAEVVAKFGRLDILINNAGILRDKSFAKMTDQEWAQVINVHLYGTYRMTKAAFPVMLKQKYGRIIDTSSAVGLYGNFGQANYSTAKAALIGFTNSIAQEGKRANIVASTIAPSAGTAMTKTIFTNEVVETLKPEYLAPFVGFFAHESFTEGGGVYEVGSGWCAKVRWQRTLGGSVPTNRPVALEAVRQIWPQVCDFAKVSYPRTPQESFEQMIANISRKSASKNDGADAAVEVSKRDVMLYNLGIGCSEKDLKYVYENDPSFAAFPTFGVIPSFKSMMGEPLERYLDNYSPIMLLHGEQYLEIVKPISTDGQVRSSLEVLEINQKGRSGSTVVIQVISKDARGETICINEGTLFLRGASPKAGFVNKTERRRAKASETVPVPSRAPDATVQQRVPENQAAIYRLSGDYNPLHIDPVFAGKAGFKKPILHGLCSFGMAARHVIETFAGNDPSRLKSVKARFTKHVFPGDQVQTEMWRVSPTLIVLQFRVLGRDDIAISNAFVELFAEGETPKASAAPVAGGAASESMKIVKQLRANLEKAPEAMRAGLVTKTNGVFEFVIGPDAFVIDLKNGNGSVSLGKASGKPDISITVGDKDFVQLAAGKMTGQQAFMKGLVKVKGNMMMAMKLDPVLKALKGTPQSKL